MVLAVAVKLLVAKLSHVTRTNPVTKRTLKKLVAKIKKHVKKRLVRKKERQDIVGINFCQRC